MTSFKTRIQDISKKKGKLILANDYKQTSANLLNLTIKNIEKLHPYLCGIKLNFHLLLPLGKTDVKKITKLCHKRDLVAIADIKLNDIGNTNEITLQNLWRMGFDAVIVNPIMGPENLKKTVRLAHKEERGIISLCHMSAPEAKLSYDMEVNWPETKNQTPLYMLFLDWAISNKVDGIIVGATFPSIIRFCKRQARKTLKIYSPGIGVQGGKVAQTLDAGSDFLIVGRTIIDSKNPVEIAKEFQKLTLR